MAPNGKPGVYLSLSADIFCVQGARQTGVGGAFDDRAPVRKDGHFIGFAEKAQPELVSPHFAERLQLNLELREIDGAAALVNLDGVPPAEADGRAPVAIEIREFTTRADG